MLDKHKQVEWLRTYGPNAPQPIPDATSSSSPSPSNTVSNIDSSKTKDHKLTSTKKSVNKATAILKEKANQLVVGDTHYLIPIPWALQLENYLGAKNILVLSIFGNPPSSNEYAYQHTNGNGNGNSNNKTNTKPNAKAKQTTDELPVPLLNLDILVDNYGYPSRNKYENQDFIIVNAKVWEFIRTNYRIDPASKCTSLPCKVVQGLGGPRIEVYPLTLQFELLQNALDESDSNKSMLHKYENAKSIQLHGIWLRDKITYVIERVLKEFRVDYTEADLNPSVLEFDDDSMDTATPADPDHVSESGSVDFVDTPKPAMTTSALPVQPSFRFKIQDASDGTPIKYTETTTVAEVTFYDMQSIALVDTRPPGWTQRKASSSAPMVPPLVPPPPPPPPPSAAKSRQTTKTAIAPPPPPPLPPARATSTASASSQVSALGDKEDKDEKEDRMESESNKAAPKPTSDAVDEERLVSMAVEPSQLGEKAGLIGLVNLGNTCFMNSSLQCLSNTDALTQYFLSNNYLKDINKSNPLGMGGELAIEFNKLLRQLWLREHQSTSPTQRSSFSSNAVAPRAFKQRMSIWAPQFSGYYQHDSQELLAFLLDGLHEDLNRIEKKPYVETVEAKDGETDDYVAKEAWRRHKLRHDSVIVDNFQGQYKSKVVCPDCGRVSVTFDPFMYLTLPIPSKAVRCITVLLTRMPVSPTEMDQQTQTDPIKKTYPTTTNDRYTARPLKYGVTVPRMGKVADLRRKLAELSGVDVSRLVLAKVSMNRLKEFPIHDDVSLEEIRDMNVSVVAYEVEHDISVLNGSAPRVFGPLVSMPPTACGNSGNSVNSGMNGYHHASTSPENVVLIEIIQRVTNSEVEESKSSIALPFLISALRDEISGALFSESILARVRRYFDQNRYYLKQARTSASPSSSSSSSLETNPEMHARGEGHSAHFKMIRTGAVTRSQRRNLYPFKLRLTENENDHSIKYSSSTAIVVYGPDEESGSAGASSSAAKRDLDSGIDLNPSSVEKIVDPTTEWKKGCLTVEWIGGPAFEDSYDRDDCLLNSCDLHESFANTSAVANKSSLSKDSVSLHDCLDLWGETEVLSEDNMWFCSQCKEHKRASKSLLLWRAPEILIVHLKRFSYTTWNRNKLDTLVDFPLEHLDISKYVGSLGHDGCVPCPPIYDLFAVSNHFGSLGGGHYTAYAKSPWKQNPTSMEESPSKPNGVAAMDKESDDGMSSEANVSRLNEAHHGFDGWYSFDDSYVSHIRELDQIKSSSAYLLFYKKRSPVN
eukprot:CAMPEP_0184692250 /NCGR_PEP_ID=MMETSP0313-20130426/804_1 /TAXON_ID=2792 /ORGANISM="Porphyridium aerugineum, Strain SAG 1380-2" /LENGTH=1268 /DNA_ID=CAMNT_0027150069 /DNA_START=258 /DNA_END=4064 /DNA_ORIENTATION=-